jgi:hypothetical protein
VCKPSRKRAVSVVVALAVVLVAAAGTLAAATHRSARRANPVIRACVSHSGTVRILARKQHCGHHRRALSWRQRGATGPRGRTGPAGPGAVRLAYRARASATTPYTRVLALDGLTLRISCRKARGETQAKFSITSRKNATLRGTSIADRPSDPNGHSNGSPEVTFVTGSLPGGRTLLPGGPRASSGSAQEVENVIYTSPTHVISFNMAVTIDATHGTCSLTGTAVPA